MENAIDKVKRKLWTFGYSVKEVRGVPGVDYDLLVDGKYKVKVFDGGKGNIEALPRSMVAVIVEGDEIKYNLCKAGRCWEETSPLKAFPKVEH